MDYDTVSADAFGRSLRGVGVNLLVTHVRATATFLTSVFDMSAFQVTDDFGILRFQDDVFQIHADATYHANPLLALVPENPPRGAGLELRLYGADPDLACSRAEAGGGTILQAATDKPHGLREAFILDLDGYCWCPSVPLPSLKSD